MRSKFHASFPLSVTVLYIYIAITIPDLLLFSPNSAYSTTHQQDEVPEITDAFTVENEETETSQRNSDIKQSDNELNITEVVNPEGQNQVQHPLQLDTISPNVLSVTPNVGTSGIPLSSPITATFSEPVEPSSVNAKTFTLVTGNSEVQGNISLSSDGTTAILTPSLALSGSTIYTATISEVRDLAGNTMNFVSPWSFTTEAQSSSPSQQTPPQQPSPSTPSIPASESNSGGAGSGGVLGDIKTSPTEKDILKDAAQYVEDEKLVDRILPIILSKMDKRQLAATVLPYLDFQVSVRQAQGEVKKAEGDTERAITTEGSCAADEILIGGGFQAGGASRIYYTEIVNGKWLVYGDHNPIDNPSSSSSTVASYPICLKAELVPKDPNMPTLKNGGP